MAAACYKKQQALSADSQVVYNKYYCSHMQLASPIFSLVFVLTFSEVKTVFFFVL